MRMDLGPDVACFLVALVHPLPHYQIRARFVKPQ